MRQLGLLVSFLLLLAVALATPLVYRPYKLPPQEYPIRAYNKRSNAELINGLIGMDFNRLNHIGKRSNAELVNGLIGMDLNHLEMMGRR